MKMIVAIIDDGISDTVSQALLGRKFRVTRLASTGGLLRSGTTTFMIGVDNADVDDALQIIRENIPTTDLAEKVQATIYVLNVKNFERV